MDLDVAHRESGLMGGYLHVEEMDFTHMDDDVGIYAADFKQNIDTKHHGQHVVDEMKTTSWTWAWLTWMKMYS